ncbi:hypothetical protein GKQ38_00875 [Candidatus Nanohaloarchaea archaeon]|nr:hypothetical protein GKQ38_00875 [Candidatus Nanohaloarchaea archaeon]
MDERHLKILREIWNHKERTGAAPTIRSFDEVDGREVSKADIEYLEDYNLVDWNHSIVLTHNGIDKLQDYTLLEEIEKNRQFNQKLMEQEKKSSAVETLFTITLVAFSFVQITTLLLRGQPTGSDYLTTIIVTIFMIAVIYVALEINGDNLEDVANQTKWTIPLVSKEAQKTEDE